LEVGGLRWFQHGYSSRRGSVCKMETARRSMVHRQSVRATRS
jgi:hypothetical protein